MCASAVKTQTALAARLGIATQRITEAIKRGHIPEAWLYKVAYKTGFNVEWLRSGRGERKNPMMVGEQPLPYLAKVPAGPMGSALDPYPYPGAAQDFLTLIEKGRRAIALKVKGASMEPAFHEGDFIVIDLDATPQPGDLVVAVIDGDGEATFKRLTKKKDGMFLQPLNTEYGEIPYNKEHRLIGKVVWLVRKV